MHFIFVEDKLEEKGEGEVGSLTLGNFGRAARFPFRGAGKTTVLL